MRLALCAVKLNSSDLDVGEPLCCILCSGPFSADSLCNLLVLLGGTAEGEGWPYNTCTKAACPDDRSVPQLQFSHLCSFILLRLIFATAQTVCADAPDCGANSSGSLLLQITTGLKGHRGFDQLRLGQKQSHLEVILSIAFTFQRTGREERNLRAAEKLREKCSKQTAILHLKRTVMNT